MSRFEHALKRSEYLKPGEDANRNWDRFSSDHNAQFQKKVSPPLAAAVDYFQKSPPRKQKQTGGQLNWSEPLSPRVASSNDATISLPLAPNATPVGVGDRQRQRATFTTFCANEATT